MTRWTCRSRGSTRTPCRAATPRPLATLPRRRCSPTAWPRRRTHRRACRWSTRTVPPCPPPTSSTWSPPPAKSRPRPRRWASTHTASTMTRPAPPRPGPCTTWIRAAACRCRMATHWRRACLSGRSAPRGPRRPPAMFIRIARARCWRPRPGSPSPPGQRARQMPTLRPPARSFWAPVTRSTKKACA